MDDHIVVLLHETAVPSTAAVDGRQLYRQAQRRRSRRHAAAAVVGVAAAVSAGVMVSPQLWQRDSTTVTFQPPSESASSAPDPLALTPEWAHMTAPVGTFGGTDQPMGPVQAGNVVVVATDPEAGIVQGFDADTRELLWTYRTGTDSAFIGPHTDQLILVAPYKGSVAAVDLATGKPTWNLEVGGTAGAPTIHRGVVYQPVSHTSEGDTRRPHIVAVDLATGETEWVAPLIEGADLQWYPPLVHAGMVIVSDTPSHPGSTSTSRVFALDEETGRIRWTADLEDPQQGFRSDPPLQDESTLFTITQYGVAAIDTVDGALLWRQDLSGALTLERVDNSKLYVRTDDGMKILNRNSGRPIN